MNNDLKEQDMTYSGDPMFDEMLKDLLSLSAVTNGEKNNGIEEDTNVNTDSSENSDNSDHFAVKS